MDRRKFLGATVGAAAALGGRMGITQYDAATGSFVPTRCMVYDTDKIMSYWKGTSCYQYDSSSGDFIDAYLPDGLVGYWDFQPSSISGDTVEDRSKNHNDGTIHGPITTSDGIIGQELVFDRDTAGTTYVSVPFHPSLNIQSGDFTIAAWVRLEEIAGKRYSNTNPNHGIIEHKDATGTADKNSGYMLQVVGEGDYGANFANVAAFVTGNEFNGTYTLKDMGRVTAGPYMHLCVTFDIETRTTTAYVDGYERASVSRPKGAVPIVNQNDLQIGTHRTANGTIDGPLGGGISEIRLYDRKLPKPEIDALVGLGNGAGGLFQAEQLRTPPEFHTRDGTKYGYNDAVAVYDGTKANPYRLIVYGNAQANTYNRRGNNLYESADLTNWSLVAEDITDDKTLQDVVTHNGTHYLYDSGGGGAGLWSGSSLTNLTYQGIAASGLSDVGAYYDSGTWYLFPEEAPVQHAPSGNRVGIWTSDRPDGGFTRQATAFDFSDRPYVSGDPDVIKHDGRYWMFCDCEHQHPFYGTALFRSDNLIDWEFITDDIKSHVGGDFQTLKTPSGLVGFTEFAYNQFGGIGVYDVTYIPEG